MGDDVFYTTYVIPDDTTQVPIEEAVGFSWQF
jgi:hypothetical protein